MRQILLIYFLLLTVSSFSQVDNDAYKILEHKIEILEKKQRKSQNAEYILNNKISDVESRLNKTNNAIDSINETAKTLSTGINKVDENLKDNVSKIDGKINETIYYTSDIVSRRTKLVVLGIVFVFIFFAVAIYFVYNHLKKKYNSIDNLEAAHVKIEEAQRELKSAQLRLEEDSIKLDGELIKLLNKQLNQSDQLQKVDHSLALKIADEMTRIEVNLSRMDPSVRGYKQLAKALQRMKEDYLQKGYEISDLLGKKYVEGMKVIADFVVDETLPMGSQIITSIKKPQIVYNGSLLQAAEITVSQNIE